MGKDRGRRRRRAGAPPRQDPATPEAGAAVASAAGSGAKRPSPKPAWRQQLDSWGGPWVIGVLVASIALIAVLAWVNRPQAATEPSTGELMGEEYPITSSSHVATVGELQITPGIPPAGGPHFVQPMDTGVYNEPVPDGRVIHSLEHGIIWISYNPDLVTSEDLAAMGRVAGEHSRDVILSPRPENSMPIAIASWGRLLRMDSADEDLLNQFVQTNVNRSPEPGLR